MHLADELLTRLAGQEITRDESVRLRCRLSRTLEEAGDYEGARAALGDLWRRVGERPAVEGLAEDLRAEVLLQVGKLTGYLGSASQTEGAQETAKNLIGESVRLLEGSGRQVRAAEALTDLAVCYWREGAFDEARALLRDALSRIGDADTEVRAVALLRSAIVEKVANRLNDALRIHAEAAPLFEASGSHLLKGKFHGEFGTVLKNLGAAEKREEYFDRALVEFAAASYHFEQAGHARYRARVENNLGMLFMQVSRIPEAHEHLDRARRLFVSLKDSGSVAQVDETRARALIAEGLYARAADVAAGAARALARGGEQALLAEALVTHGVALARAGEHARARVSLRRALETAEQAGDSEGAGLAALSLIEELSGQTPARELGELYGRASVLLSRAQHPGILARLNSCAVRVIGELADEQPRAAAPAAQAEAPRARAAYAAEAGDRWAGFSLKNEVRRYEGVLISRALRDAGGVVSRAAQLLGFRHYQTLIALLNSRHPELLEARTPIVPRRRSIARRRAAGDK